MRLFPRFRASVATRIAFSLMLLSITSYLTALQITRQKSADELSFHRRTTLCESLAISCSLFAERREEARIKVNLEAVLARNPDILSGAVRLEDGRFAAVVGPHKELWVDPSTKGGDPNHLLVPISRGGIPWGRLELCFDKERKGVLGLIRHPVWGVVAIMWLLNLGLFRWYLGRILQYLNPSNAVPEHVRSTLDTFAEGVVVLDKNYRVVLANVAFARQVEKSVESLVGREIDSFGWKFDSDETQPPWRALGEEGLCTGRQVQLTSEDGKTTRCYLVNASPITGHDGKRRGTVASFDDVTAMEQKREELREMLSDLQLSREELSKRNRELHILATRDALTGCLNRRTFYETFTNFWDNVQAGQGPLSCLMVDIDHFKSINDRYGHAMGDEVLKAVAKVLLTHVSEPGIAARYGGEEFCVLVPNCNMEQAAVLGEQLRQAIAAIQFSQLSVTTSVGVSCTDTKQKTYQDLMEQADKCLYVAKRGGRNQVVRWDQVPEDLVVDESKLSRSGEDVSISYPAVTSLLSALAYRHPDTAAHSMRVAELAVMAGRKLMSAKDSYILEIGALLHDIGKIGVPDAILLKPGPLTKEEWTIMHVHDKVGMDIVEASFANRQLIDIVRFHHCTFGGSPDAPDLPKGEEIPVGARLVTIADAYDAMVSDRVYRKGRTQQEAFAELRRCAGRQFDPTLVEHFIEAVEQYQPQLVNVNSKYVAMQIGSNLERLHEAYDARDMKTIKALAARLEATASNSEIPEIREIAAQISRTNLDDEQAIKLLEMAQELIDLCRSAQRAYATIDVEELEATDRGKSLN